MEPMLYLAVWAGLIFLMMRFSCGAHIMGHGHGNGQAQTSPVKLTTPRFAGCPEEGHRSCLPQDGDHRKSKV